jgi:hypothetical protein
MSQLTLRLSSNICDLDPVWVFGAIGDLTSSRWWAIVLGGIFAVVAITLLVASWTKWGQTRSLTKCIALAFLAHVWLLMYAYGTRIITPGVGDGYGGGKSTNHSLTMEVQSFEAPQESEETNESVADSQEESRMKESQPWAAPLQNAEVPPTPIPELPTPPLLSQSAVPAQLASTQLSELAAIDGQPDWSELESLLQTAQQSTPARPPSAIQPPKPAIASISPYQMRLSPNRGQIVAAGGGDANTEASVANALEWLASVQASDGGWYGSQYGAGDPKLSLRAGPDGEFRRNAGVRANTAMTGLALLAFLGAGHTHLEGRYAANVQNGINYLTRQQLPSGDLSGRDQVGRDESVRFARMYSHGMASLAVAEAYAMTRDPNLASTVAAACRYSLQAMNPRTGGWRYEFPTDDPGDMSQFGWQAMLLDSANGSQAFPLSSEIRGLHERFLNSVASGNAGGLATYRPRINGIPRGEPPSASMTAEALACRSLLSIPTSPQAIDEGTRLIMTQRPGAARDNFYLWYYATMALFQQRQKDPNNIESQLAWTTWNEAMKQHLCGTQVPSGQLRGSWNPTCVWGEYGGRIYTTALGCMCLEVYYRYLPMYQ